MWKEVTSECQPSTLALRLSKGWKVSLGHQTCDSSKLSSRLLATSSPACLAPSSHVDGTHHRALCATPHSVSDGCRQNSVPGAFPLFDQMGRLWATRAFQKHVLSLPIDGCGRSKNFSKADREEKNPCKQKSKRGGLWNLATTEVRGKFLRKSVTPVLLQQDWKAKRDGSLKIFKKKLPFCFLSCTVN